MIPLLHEAVSSIAAKNAIAYRVRARLFICKGGVMFARFVRCRHTRKMCDDSSVVGGKKNTRVRDTIRPFNHDFGRTHVH